MCVAIPSLIGYRYLRGRVDSLVVRMEKEVMKFLEALSHHQIKDNLDSEFSEPPERRS